MKRSFLHSLCTVAFLVIGLHPSSGQKDTLDLTELSLEDLQNIPITSVSKTLEKAGRAPATTIVVTEEQIRIRWYRSLLDVIRDLPDIKVDDNSNTPTRNTFKVRGTEGQDKFIIMIDGVRISSPTNEAMPIMENYPVHVASQIEIVYGPASALSMLLS